MSSTQTITSSVPRGLKASRWAPISTPATGPPWTKSINPVAIGNKTSQRAVISLPVAPLSTTMTTAPTSASVKNTRQGNTSRRDKPSVTKPEASSYPKEKGAKGAKAMVTSQPTQGLSSKPIAPSPPPRMEGEFYLSPAATEGVVVINKFPKGAKGLRASRWADVPDQSTEVKAIPVPSVKFTPESSMKAVTSAAPSIQPTTEKNLYISPAATEGVVIVNEFREVAKSLSASLWADDWSGDWAHDVPVPTTEAILVPSEEPTSKSSTQGVTPAAPSIPPTPKEVLYISPRVTEGVVVINKFPERAFPRWVDTEVKFVKITPVPSAEPKSESNKQATTPAAPSVKPTTEDVFCLSTRATEGVMVINEFPKGALGLSAFRWADQPAPSTRRTPAPLTAEATVAVSTQATAEPLTTTTEFRLSPNATEGVNMVNEFPKGAKGLRASRWGEEFPIPPTPAEPEYHQTPGARGRGAAMNNNRPGGSGSLAKSRWANTTAAPTKPSRVRKQTRRVYK